MKNPYELPPKRVDCTRQGELERAANRFLLTYSGVIVRTVREENIKTLDYWNMVDKMPSEHSGEAIEMISHSQDKLVVMLYTPFKEQKFVFYGELVNLGRVFEKLDNFCEEKKR